MHDPVQDILELVADGELSSALAQLDQLIREEPYQASFLALRALILTDLNRRQEARESVRAAFEGSADNPFVHHAAAVVALHSGEVQEAIAHAQDAQRLAPGYHQAALLEARARAHLGQWPQVVAIAREVLAHFPEEEEEASILEELASSAGSKSPLESAAWRRLSERFPLNPTARTAHGWTRLHAGQIRDAKREFEQALALDPSSEWAREGLVLALKARSPVYALLLRYFLWSGRLPARTRNIIAFGGVLGYNFLRRLSEQSPALKPFIVPILVAYALFLFLTWLADPLLNLALLATADGRRLLSNDDKRSGVAVGACLGVAALLALAGWRLAEEQLLLGAIPLTFASLPVAAYFNTPPSGKRDRLGVMAAVAIVLALAAALAPAEYQVTTLILSLLLSAAGTWYSRLGTARPHLP